MFSTGKNKEEKWESILQKDLEWRFWLIFLVACLTFLLMNAVPGSPWLSEKTPSETTLAALNAKYGLDKPVLEGYFIWLGKAVHGEFGESWIFHQPVKQKFASVIWYSFALALASFLLELSLPYLWVLYRQRSSTAGLIMQLPFLHWSVFRCRPFSLLPFWNGFSLLIWNGLTCMVS